MSPQANKVPSRILAEELGISIDTLDRWARETPELAACRWRKGWWDVSLLRGAGFLQPMPMAVVHA